MTTQLGVLRTTYLILMFYENWELESELDAETRRYGDVTKNLRKSERAIKELTFAGDEDRKNHERMQALIDQLQGKVTDENYAHI